MKLREIRRGQCFKSENVVYMKITDCTAVVHGIVLVESDTRQRITRGDQYSFNSDHEVELTTVHFKVLERDQV